MKIFPPAIDRFSTAFHPTIHTPSSLFTTYLTVYALSHCSYLFPFFVLLFPLSMPLLLSLFAVVPLSVCRCSPLSLALFSPPFAQITTCFCGKYRQIVVILPPKLGIGSEQWSISFSELWIMALMNKLSTV